MGELYIEPEVIEDIKPENGTRARRVKYEGHVTFKGDCELPTLRIPNPEETYSASMSCYNCCNDFVEHGIVNGTTTEEHFSPENGPVCPNCKCNPTVI